jgi:hypothetical protein
MKKEKKIFSLGGYAIYIDDTENPAKRYALRSSEFKLAEHFQKIETAMKYLYILLTTKR